MKSTLTLAAALLCGVASAEVPAPLTIGDKAPTLQTANWLKGDKYPRFEEGKVYVVEFWATWCGPCKENIPHLTELAKKYKDKVAIIGVSIWENLEGQSGDSLKKVTSFVQSQGDKMDYNVAADDTKDTIANTWMKPAGEGGIPCSFIVDGSGTIAWIGHPAKMEESLVKVLDGTFDIKAARESREFEHKYTLPINEALEKRQYDVLLKTIDEAVAARPSLEYNLTYNRLVALFHVDLNQGKEYVAKILKDSNNAPGAFHMASSIFAAYDDLSADAYNYGLTIATKGIEKSPENIMLNAIEAEIFFHLKDKAKAVVSIKVAIKKAKDEPRTTKQFQDMLDRSLKKYEDMSSSPASFDGNS